MSISKQITNLFGITTNHWRITNILIDHLARSIEVTASGYEDEECFKIGCPAMDIFKKTYSADDFEEVIYRKDTIRVPNKLFIHYNEVTELAYKLLLQEDKFRDGTIKIKDDEIITDIPEDDSNESFEAPPENDGSVPNVLPGDEEDEFITETEDTPTVLPTEDEEYLTETEHDKTTLPEGDN